ncbi:MAG: peptidylprolyl isomerase [Bacteroidales bacterium]|nr:peptidylprolyl isomerase [Bacteroidales bacterium]MCF8403574.1 peptidylprolyl isomerase [Bacteroidales bacterium]
MNTGFGTVRFWLYHNTPLHRANFLDLAGQAFYDGLIFHRVVQDFVIQGGDPDGTGYGGPGYTIPAEIVPGLNHAYGAVGAARLADNVNPDKESNGSQFYMVSDQNGEPGLNGNYTVFGMVFEGLDVVYAISQVPVDANQKPITDVVMDQVNIEYFTAEELHSTYGFDIP